MASHAQQRIARVLDQWGEIDYQNSRANAALIASAPAMLAALHELLAIGEGGVIEFRKTGKRIWCILDAVKEIARAAIAQAEGKE